MRLCRAVARGFRLPLNLAVNAQKDPQGHPLCSAAAPPGSEIIIAGGGPSGAAAAIAARLEDRNVTLFEKSRFPRHKVCGEFLSPEIAPILEQLGVWGNFNTAAPARIRRLVLRFRAREKRCNLPETAYGLSRYAFDDLLLRAASTAGAGIIHQPAEQNAQIIAHGRKFTSPRGRRLFGFKAHFEGPPNDDVELFFFDRFYVGLNQVENGITNICGLGPEDLLRARRFEIDEVLNSFAPMRERLAPLRRTMEWLNVGPLVFENRLHSDDGAYYAGDALSFVDPFTGSGMLSAVLTGRLAGIAASRKTPTRDYLNECRQRLERPFLMSSIFRKALSAGWAEPLASLIPGSWLVRLTRPA